MAFNSAILSPWAIQVKRSSLIMLSFGRNCGGNATHWVMLTIGTIGRQFASGW